MMKEYSPEQKARIERVKRLANIRLVMNDLEIPYTERKRNDLWFKCLVPIHKERDASTHICADPTDTRHGQWKCFGCGESGDIIHMVQMSTSLSFWEVVQWLEVRLGDECVQQTIERPTPKLPVHFKHPVVATDWNEPYLHYLLKRKIPWYQILQHNIGYVDTGRLKWRVIVPVMLDNRLTTWVGRGINKQVSRVTSCPGGTVGLFASELAKSNEPAIVVEGWADCLRLERMGYHNVMAIQTNQLQEVQFEFLKRFPYVIVMPDNDTGGDFLVNSLASYIEQHEFYLALLSEPGTDPDDAEESDVIRAMDCLVEWKPRVMVPEVEIYW